MADGETVLGIDSLLDEVSLRANGSLVASSGAIVGTLSTVYMHREGLEPGSTLQLWLLDDPDPGGSRRTYAGVRCLAPLADDPLLPEQDPDDSIIEL